MVCAYRLIKDQVVVILIWRLSHVQAPADINNGSSKIELYVKY